MSNKFDFFTQCIQIGGDRIFLVGVGVEIAVGAAMGAKRNVEIE
jgi:hypothetical protein